ncbi:cation:dicarboxylase symporter family transporter [Lysobacter sp. M2-1]|uniref:dicarboxylate/amino acid:cation symporter n=1 Tax=Lysobacter sp. M2-1 TaxID=2916839 RepID=UPI001F5AEB47|nr:cation:dicarboxylase symporter family transporter [Lysobacter sp. M2-1]
MSNTTRVLLALALGALIGLALGFWDADSAARVAAIAQPIGKVWLNALQMTVVPLVAAMIVIGINAARSAASTGRTARTAVIVFVVLLSLASALTAVLAPTFLALLPRNPDLVQALRGAMAPTEAAAGTAGLAEWLAGVVPSNAVAAAAAGAMLPLVVFSLFFGFALTRIEEERRVALLRIVHGIADTMIVIVRWVLLAAPLGVFALALAVTATVGHSLLAALGYYIALLIVMYVITTLLLYPVAVLAGRERFGRFASAIIPAQAIAASTQSSLASLPAMMESARTRLGYPVAVPSLVLPMAVSLFRITSPVQYICVASFIAWAYGIPLDPVTLAGGAALAVVVSMGSVGLPGQAIFMATNLPVAQAMHLPLEPLGILLALDTIPDVFATVGNVTGDLTATAVVARRASPDAAPDPTTTSD